MISGWIARGRASWHTLRGFAGYLNDVETAAFIVQQWPINHIDFIDDYGDPVPDYGNGSQFIPEAAHMEFLAMCLTDPTGYSFGQLMDMQYDEFVRIAALARAKRWTPATKNKYDRYL